MSSLPARAAKILMSPPILLMVSKVYIPVLFPTTFLFAWGSLQFDKVLVSAGIPHMSELLPQPINFVVAALSFVLGFAIWSVTYTFLVGDGDGSPSPVAGRTRKLVVRGFYAYTRNPSVWGKLFGVEAVGIALQSWSFTCILIPIVLTISVWEKITLQEPQLVDVFGDEYEEYRKNVPAFFPRLTPWKPPGQ